ncbi:hypothetical protein N8K70_02505 [Microbacterium betulae]|uniref:Uncharacterized protein n=1 Tax=Microbacterium betulae TaxID=2981139 RepID=A0AA97FJ18_9MICO|nr:hypothetical protein [Microbacterium sp. AB]WOF23569.1 hypothetical protein N8K70_02505 [Microbacterium sp. AB]
MSERESRTDETRDGETRVFAPIATASIPTDAEVLPALAAGTEQESPRIRWASVIWGVVFTALAGAGLWVATSPGRYLDAQSATIDWVLAVDPVTGTVAVVLVAGVVILVAGLAGPARRIQRRLSARG